MWTIAINAGGESRRMGENKALKAFGARREPLIARMVERLRPGCDELLVTTNQLPDFAFLGVPLYADSQPGNGALGGLLTAIESAQSPLVAVVACDMPFINPKLLAEERDLLIRENADVVIPTTVDGLEPMHAVYRRAVCLPAIQAALAAGQKKVISWFPAVRVRVMEMAEVAQIDPQFRSFVNLNTPEDFKNAEQLDQAAGLET